MTDERHQPIDITTLTWEPLSPSRDTEPFDPRIDITEEDWQAMKRKSDSGAGRQMLLVPLKILFPDRTAELNLDDGLYLYLKGEADHAAREARFGAIVAHANDIKILYPDKLAELELSNTDWERMQELSLWNRPFSLTKAVEIAIIMEPTILFPQRISEIRNREHLWQSYKEELEFYRQQPLSLCQAIETAARLKMLFPERADQLDIDKIDWKKVRQELSGARRNGNWRSFSKLALDSAILAAEKVEITDRGIELVFDRSDTFKEQVPPMPPMRKF